MFVLTSEFGVNRTSIDESINETFMCNFLKILQKHRLGTWKK